jgi:AraC family transcriptional regulator, transcriptional activator of pobA
MKHFRSLSELHKDHNYEPPENPMLSLVTCNYSETIKHTEFTSDFYLIVFKKINSGEVVYGRTKYDHQSGSMLFFKPHQLIEIKDIGFQDKAFTIHFHTDFLNGHPLYEEIKKYGFFDYEVNEALHLSPREEQTVWELYHKIETEYQNNQDEYSREIILSHIDSMLKYAKRFYKRQFLTRKEQSGKTVTKFNQALQTYFENGSLNERGFPTVKFMAADLKISPGYLSDLLKQETGKTASELIHIYLVSEAKNMLTSEDTSVSEISYRLGFENPPYFSRLFKKEIGLSPKQFRKLHTN